MNLEIYGLPWFADFWFHPHLNLFLFIFLCPNFPFLWRQTSYCIRDPPYFNMILSLIIIYATTLFLKRSHSEVLSVQISTWIFTVHNPTHNNICSYMDSLIKDFVCVSCLTVPVPKCTQDHNCAHLNQCPVGHWLRMEGSDHTVFLM